MSLPTKFILFLGRTFSGHHHDYSMLKQELPPHLDWFTDFHMQVDLGYLGIQADYRDDRIDIPTKKPRKSKKNPSPELGSSTLNRGHEHQCLIKRCNAREGRPRCFGGTPKGQNIGTRQFT